MEENERYRFYSTEPIAEPVYLKGRPNHEFIALFGVMDLINAFEYVMNDVDEVEYTRRYNEPAVSKFSYLKSFVGKKIHKRSIIDDVDEIIYSQNMHSRAMRIRIEDLSDWRHDSNLSTVFISHSWTDSSPFTYNDVKDLISSLSDIVEETGDMTLKVFIDAISVSSSNLSEFISNIPLLTQYFEHVIPIGSVSKVQNSVMCQFEIMSFLLNDLLRFGCVSESKKRLEDYVSDRIDEHDSILDSSLKLSLASADSVINFRKQLSERFFKEIDPMLDSFNKLDEHSAGLYVRIKSSICVFIIYSIKIKSC